MGVVLAKSILVAAFLAEVTRLPGQSGAWQSAAQKSAKVGWKAASFRGLAVGKASRTEVLRVLGQPSSERAEPDGQRYLEYDEFSQSGGLSGHLSVILSSKTGRLLSVQLDPGFMTLGDMTKLLGTEYVITKWKWVPCADSLQEYGPIYLDPTGKLEFIEYRRLGIVVTFQRDLVQVIDYTDGTPVGYDKNPCEKGKQLKPVR
jgi:hypothetical protein